MKKTPPDTGQKAGDPPWYLSGYKIAYLQKDVAEQLRDLDKLIKHTFSLAKRTMKAAYNHYPTVRMWEKYREQFFHQMRIRFGEVEGKLQEHRVKLADALVRLDEIESALRRGQLMLSPEEERKMKMRTANLKRSLTRERRRKFEGEMTGVVPENPYTENN